VKESRAARGSGQQQSPLCKQPYNATHYGESDTVRGAVTLRQSAETVHDLAEGKRSLQKSSLAAI